MLFRSQRYSRGPAKLKDGFRIMFRLLYTASERVAKRGHFGRELSKDNSTICAVIDRFATQSGYSTVSMRCELENTLISRQLRRETPDFSFNHRTCSFRNSLARCVQQAKHDPEAIIELRWSARMPLARPAGAGHDGKTSWYGSNRNGVP